MRQHSLQPYVFNIDPKVREINYKIKTTIAETKMIAALRYWKVEYGHNFHKNIQRIKVIKAIINIKLEG